MTNDVKWVELPRMTITIDRDSTGDYILASPMYGTFRTESRETAFEVVQVWNTAHTNLIDEYRGKVGENTQSLE